MNEHRAHIENEAVIETYYAMIASATEVELEPDVYEPIGPPPDIYF